VRLLLFATGQKAPFYRVRANRQIGVVADHLTH
jgi:hypothetical protein